MTTPKYGEGSVYLRAADNRWMASIERPRKKGEPRRRWVRTAATEDEAWAKLAEMHTEVPAPVFNPSNAALARKGYMEAAKLLGTHTEKDWIALGDSVGWRCAYCDRQLLAFYIGRSRDNVAHKDHIVPVSRGGSDGIDNLAVCCRPCNSDKGTMTGDEYRRYLKGEAW